mgnify:FL=1
MVFNSVNSFEQKILIQDQEIAQLKENNMKLEDKLNELILEVKELKKLINSFKL